MLGVHDNIHNQAVMKCEQLLKKSQHIETVCVKQSSQENIDYRIWMTTSLDVVRLLLCQGVAFCGHDEAEGSSNRAIINDLYEDVLVVLIDEARDRSIKEQMAIFLRYVNKKGCVIEQFVGIVHVPNTIGTSLRTSLECFFAKHELSITRLRGKGYDGASNMQGKFNELKTLFLNENSSSFFVHCFAHQLQLALIQVSKGIDDIGSFFLVVSNVGNLISVSSKHRDHFRYKEANIVFNELESGVLLSGQGLNQELGHKRPGDTHWGSHYRTLVNLILTFSSVIKVLEDVLKDDPDSDKKAEAHNLLESMLSYEFSFTLHSMMKVLGITNEHSLALQRKDQDIVNTMKLVQVSKDYLQEMRDSGWDSLLNDVYSFCVKHDIVVEKMDAKFIAIRKSICMALERQTYIIINEMCSTSA